ncbi:hypothetical protein [Actinobacillus genomosp. 1]|uniref:hypothetical protein n=1 Tax=Actinobacillus genomosp. 1 TaxID=254839 RepID=UPI00244311CD|nr:hypothetical protein [Actinobacillus genomosp. 1]WGE91861.1 hypothetical protein NYR63_02610 [Actinobacillus genomosp. 1]
MVSTALINGAKSLVPHVLKASDAFKGLKESYEHFKMVEQREMTTREAIWANRDVELARIKSQKEILESYLKEIFKERRDMLNNTFKTLDKGLETGNLEIINMALSSIVSIAKESPLAQARQMLADVKNPNVKSIDW